MTYSGNYQQNTTSILQKSGTESHNSLGIGERYHYPPRKTFLRLCEDHPRLRKDVLFAIYMKVINDTLGPEGIVPSALVLGEFPSIRAFIGLKVPRESLAEREMVP